MISYQELADQFEPAIEWLRDLGVTKENRILQHRDNIRVLADAQANNKMDELRASLGPEKVREIFWSWVESFDFIEVFKYFQGIDPKEFLRVLKAAVEGPPDAAMESSLENTNAGRNFMFELVVAAKLARAGLQPRLGEPDVAIDFQGYRILLQCKRPFSRGGIHENIIKAGSQLRRDLAKLPNEPPAIGVVAISISKVLNQGDKIFEVNSRDDLQEALATETDEFWTKYKDSFLGLTGDQIVGALVHLSTPTVIISGHSFFTAGMTSVYAFRGSSEVRETLYHLHQAMRSS